MKLISLNQAAALLGCRRNLFYELIKTEPGFPQPVALTAHTKRFVESEIHEYIRKKAETSRTVIGNNPVPLELCTGRPTGSKSHNSRSA